MNRNAKLLRASQGTVPTNLRSVPFAARWIAAATTCSTAAKMGLSALCPLAIVLAIAVQTAWAQSELRRFEQQIRQRNASPAADTSPPKVQPPSPMILSAAVGGASAHEPAYLGMAVDDRHDRGRGVRIVAVHPGGPAERAGLRRQDLITGVTGIRVRQMADLFDVLDTFSPGQSTTFDILRNDKKQTLKVTFGRRPRRPKQPTPRRRPRFPSLALGRRPVRNQRSPRQAQPRLSRKPFSHHRPSFSRNRPSSPPARRCTPKKAEPARKRNRRPRKRNRRKTRRNASISSNAALKNWSDASSNWSGRWRRRASE